MKFSRSKTFRLIKEVKTLMRRQYLLESALIFGLILFPVFSFAQDEMTQETATTNITANVAPENLAPEQSQVETPQENIEYSFGTIANVNDIDAGKFVVKEYAYDKDMDVEVMYSADPAATLENINSLKDIAVGDMAELSYMVDADGNRSAKIIRIFKPQNRQESASESKTQEQAAPEVSTPQATTPESLPQESTPQEQLPKAE